MLIAFILLDFLVIGFHIARQFAIQGAFGETLLTDPRLDLSSRIGLRRLLELSTLATAVLFGILSFARNREPIYLCGAVALAIVLSTTGFYIHVPVGKMLGELLRIGVFYPASAASIGKALGLAVVGVALLALLVWGARRSSAGHARLGVLIVTAVILLGLFAGGVDLIQTLAYSWPRYLRSVLLVVEDGGELFFASSVAILMAIAARSPLSIADLA